MHQRKKWLTIPISEVKNNLLDLYNNYKNRLSNQKFMADLDIILKNTVTYDKEITEYGQFLGFNLEIDGDIAIKNSTININRLNTIYINLKKNELQRDFCKKVGCLYVGPCFAIREIYKTLIENGFKPRKRRLIRY